MYDKTIRTFFLRGAVNRSFALAARDVRSFAFFDLAEKKKTNAAWDAGFRADGVVDLLS